MAEFEEPDADIGSAEDEGILNRAGKMDTTMLTIFVGALIAVVILGRYLYSYFVGDTAKIESIDLKWMGEENSSIFTPPKERDEYIKLKGTLNPNNAEDLQKLKKALGRRAFQSIPLLLDLQTNGPSADKYVTYCPYFSLVDSL